MQVESETGGGSREKNISVSAPGPARDSAVRTVRKTKKRPYMTQQPMDA
jgi:hypothetical protein